MFYSFVLTPFICYLVYYFATGQPISYVEYLSRYDSWIDLGVTWFIAALLLFTLVYAVLRIPFKAGYNKPLAVPGTGIILCFAAGLGIISFLVRIIFPVGWILEPVGFQPGHFPQYIALFIVGLWASENNWFSQLSDKTGRQLKRSAWLCLLFFPVFFFHCFTAQYFSILVFRRLLLAGLSLCSLGAVDRYFNTDGIAG